VNILVCDDDQAIVDAIGIYLENEGYNVIKASNGKEALAHLDGGSRPIHLVIMDIMMPQLDGLSVTRKLREQLNNVPLILLSAKSEDYDKILGLNLGADDYVTKPFNPLELIARVKSQLRRYTSLGSLERKSHVYQTGGLVLDDESKTVTVDGEPVNLTPVQYKILRLLIANAGRVFTIEEIYEKVWNEPAFRPENTVAVHISKIREKIEINPRDPKYLKVVWGIGYKIEKC
jgi:DNA-binding response OmpR family regulator